MPLTARTVVPILAVALAIGSGIGALTVWPAGSAGRSPSATASPDGGPENSGLTSAADQQTVAVGQRLTITGRLTPAESGVRLVVQRLENGTWQDFPAATTTGNDGSYSVWVQSGRTGENTFRMIRPDDGTTSHEVRVTVG